ncbi:hypothetical protein [Enterovibrio norvegicus]|uniref:hypothetical protein n=1 Tax=Enterovibrio norvegicus TaxID=188144 RepID=UPI00352C8FC0
MNQYDLGRNKTGEWSFVKAPILILQWPIVIVSMFIIAYVVFVQFNEYRANKKVTDWIYIARVEVASFYEPVTNERTSPDGLDLEIRAALVEFANNNDGVKTVRTISKKINESGTFSASFSVLFGNGEETMVFSVESDNSRSRVQRIGNAAALKLLLSSPPPFSVSRIHTTQ